MEVNNTTTLQDDTQLWVEVNTSNTVPLVGDVATFSGVSYRVLSVEAFIVYAVTVLYKLQLRI